MADRPKDTGGTAKHPSGDRISTLNSSGGSPGSIVQEIVSSGKDYKVCIKLRKDGYYQVTIFRWTHEFVPGYGEVCEPFWEEVHQGLTLTDTLERAQELALEQLKSFE